MVITIPNADNSLIKIIETLNEKLAKPYKIINDGENDEIPNDETLNAMQECGKGNSKTYNNFASHMQEADNA